MPRDEEQRQTGDRERLWHMLDVARDALSYAQGRTRADLDSDTMLRRALINCVQEIGEAAARTSDAVRQLAPGLPWSKMVGMRHILVHAYFDVDADAVWRVIIEHLPQLVHELEQVLGKDTNG